MARQIIIMLTLISTLCSCGAPHTRMTGDISSNLDQELTAIGIVEAFRSLSDEGRYDEARQMLSPDARRWFETQEDDGMPWEIGSGGPWAKWDAHFASKKKILDRSVEHDQVIYTIEENNDYYRLLDRPAQKSQIVYILNNERRITGMIIRSLGVRDPGSTDDFLQWASSNRPSELNTLMPNGEVDPTSDHPERFRKLINEWRISKGREPIL